MEELSRARLINRVSSGAIALMIVLWGFHLSFGLGVGAVVVYSGFLALIWYGEELGMFPLRNVHGACLTPARPSHKYVVSSVGWFFLVGFPLVLMLLLNDLGLDQK